jgi:hypothetical protein
MPIILAAWEAEIQRISVRGQPRICENPSQQKMPSVVACACHPSYLGKHEQEDCSPGQFGQKRDPKLSTGGSCL